MPLSRQVCKQHITEHKIIEGNYFWSEFHLLHGWNEHRLGVEERKISRMWERVMPYCTDWKGRYMCIPNSWFFLVSGSVYMIGAPITGKD